MGVELTFAPDDGPPSARVDFLTLDTFPAATPAQIDEVCAALAAVGLAGVDEF